MDDVYIVPVFILVFLCFWVFVLLKLTFVIYCYMMYLIKKGGFTP